MFLAVSCERHKQLRPSVVAYRRGEGGRRGKDSLFVSTRIQNCNGNCRGIFGGAQSIEDGDTVVMGSEELKLLERGGWYP